jgi:cyclic pyranopterin phosphate synthase
VGGLVLTDSFGREHRDLRVSLTDRCPLRCTYCMPAEGLAWSEDLLTADEIIRVVGVATTLGITEIRLTGGEPLLRRDILAIAQAIDVPNLSLTTNGLGLARIASALKDVGVQRVNVSLDTLRPETFRTISRRDGLPAVLDGIRAARDAGLHPVKINTVLVRGVNDDEVMDLVAWARTEGLELRFIEHMPLGADHTWDRAEMVSADEVLAVLSACFTLTPVDARGSAPAETWLLDGSGPPVGVIASVSRPFCGDCDRLRLTADGQVRSCLFAHQEDDLRSLLRSGCTDEQIAEVFRRSVSRKGAGHGIGLPTFVPPERTMSAIGG